MKTLLICGLSFFSLIMSAQWKSLNGPYGGNMFEYANEGISTYVSSTNGLYRSDDSRLNWKRLDIDLSEFYEPFGFCVNGHEIFMSYLDSKTFKFKFVYSNNRGQDWAERPLLYPDWRSLEMTYSNDLLLSDSDSGLIESTDKGLSWMISNLGNRISYIEDIKSNHNFYFVGGFKSIYRRSSVDTTWQLILKTPSYYSTFHVTDSLIIVLQENKNGFRSIDNGLTWDTISLKGTVGDDRIADFGDSLYYMQVDKLYKSKDRGLNWTLLREIPQVQLTIYDLLKAGNSLLASGVNTGLIKTVDEFLNFEKSCTGIANGSSKRIIATDSFLFVLGDLYFERYDLNKKEWLANPFYSDDHLGDMLYYNKVLYVLNESSNRLYVSLDNGITFEKRTIKSFSHVPNHRRIIAYNNKILVNGYEPLLSIPVIIESEDSGNTWNYLVMKDGITNQEIPPLDFTIYNNEVYVISRSNGVNSLYKSNDLVKWETVPLNFQPNLSGYSFFELLSTGKDLFLLLTPQNSKCILFKLDTLRSTFIECNGIIDICDSHLSKNRIIDNGDTMILISKYGYYKSADKGLNWFKVVDEFKNQYYSVFRDMVYKDDKLYGATHYWGVLELGNGDIVANHEADIEKYNSIIVIPNPNHGEFRIYSPFLQNNENTSIQIFNLQSECVYIKQDKFYDGYKLQLSGIEPGIYFIQIGASTKLVNKIVITD